MKTSLFLYRNIHLDIYKHAEIANYLNHHIHKNSFSQLRIDGISDNQPHQTFLNRVDTTFVNIQFTRLSINCRNISLGILVRILHLLPNLDSLQISMLPLLQPNYLFDDNDENNCFITSLKNKITKVNLDKITDMEQTHFILRLFPFIKYLQMDISGDFDLEKFRRFILIKSSTYIPDLCSLCLTVLHADNKIVDQLQTLIKSEKLLTNYMIKRICNHILFKWN